MYPTSRRFLIEGVASAVTGAAVLIASNSSPAVAKAQRIKGGGPVVTLDSGAQYQDMTIGDGAEPRDGDRVAIHYSLFYNGEERVWSTENSVGHSTLDAHVYAWISMP